MFSKLFGKKKSVEPAKPIFELKKSWWVKTKEIFSSSAVDQADLQRCEEQLIQADLGMGLTQQVMHQFQQSYHAGSQQQPYEVLADILSGYLISHDESDLLHSKPSLILMVGVNGVGKTTTMAKLTARYQKQGQQVMLAAGDTYRAAAIKQLQVWGERLQCPVVAQQQGSDTAAVIYDAFSSAKAKDFDVLLADTAGRMHHNQGLMRELEKVSRVVKKIDEQAPNHTWLVLDATVGQNGLHQAKLFHESLNLTGVILTKLDGTAKGGIVFNICHELKLPIRYIGLGEGSADLIPFDKSWYIEQLFGEKQGN